jgi:1,4-alpha-glucan branching enzyme
VIHKDLLAIPDGGWKEIFNSDATIYGGQNIGNCGATIPATSGSLTAVVPANGLILLAKQ